MTYGNPQWHDWHWVLPEEESRPFIRRALEVGINFFDTANVYSLGLSEEILGRALRDFVRRDQVVIATKVGLPIGKGPQDRGLSRNHILDQINASLRRLGTDYIDLYQIHRWDHDTPIEETLETLHDLAKSGKVRYVGASNMRAWQFAKALYTADLQRWTRFISMQDHYNLVYREEEREMLPLCRAEGVGAIPWSPLARGFLAGNRTLDKGSGTIRSQTDDRAHRLYWQDTDFQVVDRVVELARRRGVKPAQIALAWLLHQPGITAPIIGASKAHHLEEAVSALEICLSKEECAFLEEVYQPHPILD